MNELAKKTLDALRKTDERFLNYVLVPMPTNAVFEAVADRISIGDDVVLEMDDSYKKYRHRMVAYKHTTMLLTAIQKITGEPIHSGSYAYIKPSILTDEGFDFGSAEVLASIEVGNLPSIDQAAAYHSGYDFKALLIEAIDSWHTTRKSRNKLWVPSDMNKPFIDWNRHIVSIYLELLMRCEKSEDSLISNDELRCILNDDISAEFPL